MKIGDLVRSSDIDPSRPTTMDAWTGIIIGWGGVGGKEPIVFWNDRFPTEIEYKAQLEIIS
jgi:hypothetical protein